jgi:hypothetical protein
MMMMTLMALMCSSLMMNELNRHHLDAIDEQHFVMIAYLMVHHQHDPVENMDPERHHCHHHQQLQLWRMVTFVWRIDDLMMMLMMMMMLHYIYGSAFDSFPPIHRSTPAMLPAVVM